MPAPTSSDARIGTLFGSFRIVRKLGEGGMGVVYEAEHQEIGRRAAVKILHPRFAQDEEFAQRFLNEARSVNLIRHRGLVEIFDYGKLPDGTLYYVMEFLEGASLGRRLAERRGPLPEIEAAGLGLQIARALAAAHQAGIVHRDLKPDNIMLEADPVSPEQTWVKILDFGIAKFSERGARRDSADPNDTEVSTHVGSVLGTPLYMSPEQHGRAEEADGRADVFSLGVVLYQLLTGKLPYQSSALSLLARTPPPVHKVSPAVSRRLSELVDRMMAARRDERPAMDEVVKRLAALLPGTARAGRRTLALAAGGIGLLLGVLIILLLQVERAPTPAELRNHARDVLAGYLRDSDIHVRVMAVRALGQSRDFDQRSLLLPFVDPPGNAVDPALRAEAARALGQLGAMDAQAALAALLTAGTPATVQMAAAEALAKLQSSQGLDALRRFLSDGDDLSKVQASLLLLEHRKFDGEQLVWASLTQGRLSDERQVEVLGRLARADDAQARQRLSDALGRLSKSETRVQAAYMLAQLGDDSGWEHLKRASAQDRPLSERLLALRLLAALGDTDGYEQLLALTADRKQADPVREQAMAGLGDIARYEAMPALAAILKERGASARLRIAASGAILQIGAGERARLGEQSLSCARAALGSSDAGTRELAVAMLAEISAEQAVPLLGDAVKDPAPRVRTGAIRALAKKYVHSAVLALRPALTDPDPEVRNLAVRSLGQLLRVLEQRGDKEAGRAIRAELRRMVISDSEPDRIAASSVLIQLGETQPLERNVLRSGLLSKDAQARRLALELGDVDRPALVKLLADADPSVRLSAALRLAGQDSRDGAAVLRAAAASGDRDGFSAYVALRKLGETPPPPPGLAALLTGGDLSTRLSILELLPEAPTADRLHLLRVALLDPVAVVRRRAGDAAADLYRRTHDVGFLRMVRSLRSDTDVTVRAQAVTLAEELERVQKTVAPADLASPERAQAPPPPQAGPPPDMAGPPAERVAMGAILPDGENGVRIQIDQGAPQTLTPGRPIPVPSGHHRIGYLRGATDVDVGPGQTVRVLIPVSRTEQTLQDGKDAWARKDYRRANEYFESVRTLMERTKADPSIQADYFFSRGQLFESLKQLESAISVYNSALNVPKKHRRPELENSLQLMIRRLSGTTGRIQIFTMVGGVCTLTSELLALPGEQIIRAGKDQPRTIFVSVGSVKQVKACP